MTCVHLTEAGSVATEVVRACVDCTAHGWTDWVRLRVCLTCGHVGCCDSSPHRHATGHFRESDHPVMGSAEPGESWRWCYVDEELDPGS